MTNTKANKDVKKLQTQDVAENATSFSNHRGAITADDFGIVNTIDKDMEETAIIAKLMENNNERPTIVVPLEIAGIPVTLQALTGKQVARIRSRCTRIENTKKGKVEKLDTNAFSVALIVEATVKPNWSNPVLLKQFMASSAEEYIQRKLYAGEISLLSEAVLDISGFNVDLDDIKNA